MEKIFEIKNVFKTFGETKAVEVHALSNIELNIEKGEFAALVGPSGSGKSTLLNIISGLDEATSGEVFLAGKNITSLSGDELSNFRRDHIGFVFQAYNLIPVLNIQENVEYIMLLKGVGEEDRKTRVSKVLNELGLKGMEKRFPKELSGGQQQRVAIARAIVSQPDIILADEPTANLDSKTGTDLIEIMAKLNEEYGTTFVFSTHDPKIMKAAKRLITLEDGKIIKDETR
jgi:putative ABC transport system ATP-binding protein